MVAIDLIVQHVHSQLEKVSKKGHFGNIKGIVQLKIQIDIIH